MLAQVVKAPFVIIDDIIGQVYRLTFIFGFTERMRRAHQPFESVTPLESTEAVGVER